MEFNVCHDELFPSIIQLLNEKGFIVHVFTKKQNISKNSLYFSKSLKYKFFKAKYWSFVKRFRIYDYVIFNSFEDYRQPEQSTILKEVYSTKPRKQHRVIIHNPQNLVDELKNGMILSFKPVVISNHGSSFLKNDKIENEILFPYYYGDFENKLLDKNKTIFSVQGNFSNSRRNYKSLLNAVYALSEMNEFKNKFVVKFVGRNDTEDAEKFKSLLNEKNLSSYFDFCDNVLFYENFFSEVNKSDYVIPLVDDSCDELYKYFKSVSSSSINIAVAMSKPLIINEEFAKNYPEFKSFMLEYKNDNVLDGMVKAMRLDNENYHIFVDNITKIRIAEIKKNSLCQK
ncbi:MAG: hypothetical protein KGQ36_01290 [Rickettsiales bacterium]|nr:hypothetical protein [Rickettsiales bacterium]